MKTIIHARLTQAFYDRAAKYNADNNADLSIHEYFRDHFIYATFKTVNIQQDGVSGLYKLTVEPSVKDFAPLTTLVSLFGQRATEAGVHVVDYKPHEVSVVLGEDKDEMTYLVTVNNGAMPDFECDTHEEATQWIDGFKHAAALVGMVVRVSDITE